MQRSLTLIAIGAALPVLAACGDDPVAPPADLTEGEATALFEALYGPRLDTLLTPDEPEEGSFVVPCPEGGSLTVNSDSSWVDPSDEVLHIVLWTTVIPSGCEVTAAGKRFTVDGNPNVRDSLEFKFSLVEFHLGGSTSGSLKWALDDGRSGECDLDMTMILDVDDSNPDAPTGRLIYSGKLCGHDVEVAFELELEVEGLPSSEIWLEPVPPV